MRYLTSLALALALTALAAGFSPPSARAQATVEVENLLERDVQVWIDGDARGIVAAKARERFAGVEPGRTTLMATAVGGAGVVASERRVLAPAQDFTWRIYPVVTYGEDREYGMLIVRNERDGPVTLLVGSVEAGTIAAGGIRGFPRLAVGNVPAVALDQDGREIEVEELSIEPDETTRWTIGGPDE